MNNFFNSSLLTWIPTVHSQLLWYESPESLICSGAHVGHMTSRASSTSTISAKSEQGHQWYVLPMWYAAVRVLVLQYCLLV